MRAGMTPCYGCDDRSAECHAKCERYKTWDEARKNDPGRKKREQERDVSDVIARSIYRNKRKE